MNTNLEQYIKENKVCTELIFKDWHEFLEVLYQNDKIVSGIVWFEYVEIKYQSKSMGSGGYIDSQNKDYMWAETTIYVFGLEEKKFDEIVDYVEEIIKQYPNNQLIPAFYIS